MFLRRLSALEESRLSFAIEVTLSSRRYAKNFSRWSSLGYRVVLHFIELPSADLAVRRVGERFASRADEPERFDPDRFLKPAVQARHREAIQSVGLVVVCDGLVTDGPNPRFRCTEISDEEFGGNYGWLEV